MGLTKDEVVSLADVARRWNMPSTEVVRIFGDETKPSRIFQARDCWEAQAREALMGCKLLLPGERELGRCYPTLCSLRILLDKLNDEDELFLNRRVAAEHEQMRCPHLFEQ